MSIIHAKKKIANRGLKERSISKREGWYLGKFSAVTVPILSFMYMYLNSDITAGLLKVGFQKGGT